MTVLTTPNIPATAPIASASVPTVVMRKPGERSRARQAYRRSLVHCASKCASEGLSALDSVRRLNVGQTYGSHSEAVSVRGQDRRRGSEVEHRCREEARSVREAAQPLLLLCPERLDRIRRRCPTGGNPAREERDQHQHTHRHAERASV